MGDKGKLSYLHDFKHTTIKDGKKVVHEEYVINGTKGLRIKYYHKENDNIEKIVVGTKGDGNYFLKTTKNKDTKTEENLSKDDLLKVLKKDKSLDFALDYIKKEMKGGSRKTSRKTKKSSKKSSKKGSKKGSKSRRW
uniref:Uncharacterized protein n=1 Tax=viral metagenome TaxID=1070528 RepID=A0A6C0EC76_9ZZZZ